MKITVFGGSRPKPGEPAYDDAYQFGRLLGAEGYTVLTGGYIGTMEAVSRGAAETGGRVIGVTCDEIEVWRPVSPNRWVMEEKRFPTLRQRMYALIDECDAALALPGGIGTLAEVAAMWSLLQTGAESSRPLILIGSGWQRTFQTLFESLGEYIPGEDHRLLSFAEDIETAFQTLQRLAPNP